MDRGLRQILWMSWTLRSQTLCLSYTISTRVSQTISQNYWTDNKDIRWSGKLEPLKRIMQESDTHSSTDFLHTLHTINKKHPNMDVKDTLDVLTALSKISKEGKCREDFINHKGFQSLCDQLKKQIRSMSLNEIIDSIKLLTFLKVPASTVVMNNLLQVIRISINDLHIDQVHIMLSLLNKMEGTPLSSALSIALPVVLPTIVNTKLNYDDLHELSIALYRLKCLDKHGLFIKILISIQLVIKEKSNSAPVYAVKNIFRSLCSIPSTKYNSVVYLETMELVRQALYHKTQKLERTDIIECVHAICDSVINGNMAPYNNAFMNMLLETGISKKIPFYIGCKILNYLNNIGHIYVPFIEYLLKEFKTEDSNNYEMNVLLNAFCLCDYKSIPWTYIEEKVLHKHYLSGCPGNHLLECVMCLVALDKYYPQLLSTVFIKVDMKYLKTFKNNVKHCAKFVNLYKAVKTLHPEYKGPWPSKETLSYAYEKAYYSHLHKDVMKNCIQEAMGGPEYVLNNLRTEIGHNVDYAVIMHEDGYPIAFDTKNSVLNANYDNYVENLQCPSQSYIVLILVFPQTAYSLNTQHLSNISRTELKSLEGWSGHKCIDINLNIWNKLPTNERTSYFMHRIKSIYNDVLPAM